MAIFTGELCSWTYFTLAEILVLAGNAGAGGMAPPASTRISARLRCSPWLSDAEGNNQCQVCVCVCSCVKPEGPSTRFSLAEILVLAGGAIPPAPAVPTSTRISARLKRVQEHSSPVSVWPFHFRL